jgi:tripartite-type tricarboxylate transporter receptor subunit TctC
MGLWFALVGPARMPADQVAWLNAQLNASLNSPQVIERLKGYRIDPLPGTAAELSSLISRELPQYFKLAADTGLKLD